MNDSKQDTYLDATKLIVNTAQPVLEFNEKTGRATLPSRLIDPVHLDAGVANAGKLLVDATPVADKSTVLAPDSNVDSAAQVFAPALGDSGSQNRQFVPAAEGIHDQWIGEPASKLSTGTLLLVEEGGAQSALDHAGTQPFAARSHIAPEPAPSARDPEGHAPLVTAAGPASAQQLPDAVAVSIVSQVHAGSTKISLTAATLERLHAEERATQALNKQIDALSERVARERK